jgi:hypothetical protein
MSSSLRFHSVTRHKIAFQSPEMAGMFPLLLLNRKSQSIVRLWLIVQWHLILRELCLEAASFCAEWRLLGCYAVWLL